MENNLDNEIFNKEISMCQKLFKQNGGKCNWGECEKCGVIPLLYKLGKNQFCENERDVSELKKNILQ